jgi:hypothetical protein
MMWELSLVLRIRPLGQVSLFDLLCLLDFPLALHGDLRTVQRQQRMVNNGAKLILAVRGKAVDLGGKRAGLGDGLCRRRRPCGGT